MEVSVYMATNSTSNASNKLNKPTNSVDNKPVEKVEDKVVTNSDEVIKPIDTTVNDTTDTSVEDNNNNITPEDTTDTTIDNTKPDENTPVDPTPEYQSDGTEDGKVIVHVLATRTVAGIMIPKSVDKEYQSVSYNTITLDKNNSIDVDLTEIVTLDNYSMNWIEYYRQIASLGLEVTVTDNRARS